MPEGGQMGRLHVRALEIRPSAEKEGHGAGIFREMRTS
jgi:hypothetical protein